MNYPIYFRKLKSNNYEVSTSDHFDAVVENEIELHMFFDKLSFEKSTTYSYALRGLKPARVVRANYSQSNAYYMDAVHFIKSNS